MELSSVVAARAVWFLDIDELNPYGKRLFPDILPAMVEQFGFTEVPQQFSHVDPEDKNGVAFRNGKFQPPGSRSEDIPVAFDFEIHAAGLAVQTRSTTDLSEHILARLVDWSVQNHGVNFRPSMIRYKAYVSQIVFHPDESTIKGLQKFNDFADMLSKTEIGGFTRRQALSSILYKSEGSDRWSFTFERRASAPFSENKYFSSCDAPTPVHMELLARFEKMLSE